MGQFKKVDKALKTGGMALLPTETVYGLAVDPTQTDAVDRLYALKGRVFNKPLALCVKSLKQADHYGDMRGLARKLAKTFWPGPLTIIVPAHDPLDLDPRLLSTNRTGQKTIALRCPDIAWAKRLKSLPLALTSANPSGAPDPLTFREAFHTMGSQVQAYIDSPTEGRGLPSTILSVSGRSVKILREGRLSADAFAKFDIDWSA